MEVEERGDTGLDSPDSSRSVLRPRLSTTDIPLNTRRHTCFPVALRTKTSVSLHLHPRVEPPALDEQRREDTEVRIPWHTGSLSTNWQGPESTFYGSTDDGCVDSWSGIGCRSSTTWRCRKTNGRLQWENILVFDESVSLFYVQGQRGVRPEPSDDESDDVPSVPPSLRPVRHDRWRTSKYDLQGRGPWNGQDVDRCLRPGCRSAVPRVGWP